MKEHVKKPVETDQKGKNGLPAPTPFLIGDVVMKGDQRGKVTYSDYFDPASPDYGKKVTVAIIGDDHTWAVDDLADGMAVKPGVMVAHKDGTKALVLGITTDGIRVQDKRVVEVWETDGLVQVDELATHAAQKADEAGLVPTESAESAVEVKTLVQELSTISGYHTAYADRDLANALGDGWTILNISVVTEPSGDSDCISANLLRVVTLERRNQAAEVQPVNGAAKVVAVVDVPATVVDTPAKTQTAAHAPIVVTVEHPEPERQPVAITFHPPVSASRTISFEEALANPRMSAAEVAEVGNRIAFERGKAVFEGLQKASYGNAHSRPFGSGVRRAGAR